MTETGTRTGWGLVGVAAALLLFLSIARSPSASKDDALTNTMDRTEASAPPAEVSNVLTTPGTVWDLELDSAGSVWFVAGDGQSWELHRVEGTTGDVQRWPLPPADYGSVHHRIRIGDDGRVFLSANYSLVRLDPETGETLTVTLDQKPEGLLEGAFDRSSAEPGSWISSFDVSGGELVVARNNVPSLTVLDANTMTERRQIQLSDKYAGSWDLVMEGPRIYVLSGILQPGAIAMVVNDRLTAELPLEAMRLVAGPGGVVASALSGNGSVVTANGEVRRGPRMPPSPLSAATADPRRGVTIYDSVAGELRHVVGGELVSAIELPTQAIPARMGQDAQVVPPSITDLVTDTDGRTWLFDGRSLTLLRVNLP